MGDGGACVRLTATSRASSYDRRAADSDLIRVLLICGAGPELAGFVLVAWDVIDDRRELRALSGRDVLIQSGAARLDMKVGMTTEVVRDPVPVPSVDERVATLESEVELLKRTLNETAERERAARRALSDQAATWVAEARRETWELRQELRPLIGRVSAGNLRRRSWGVVLFAVGLIVQSIANYGSL